METIIYVDILFLINLIMDGLCLALTSTFTSKRIVWWRFFCASIFGGIYSIATVALSLSPFHAVLLHLTAAYVICVIAFKHESGKATLYATACFFFSNAVLGGVMFALYSLCGSFAVYNGAFYAELSPLALIVSGVLVTTTLLLCITKGKAASKAGCCEIKIVFREKACTVSCMTDSGNLLVCPYTALPVAIISRRAAEGLFSADELALLSASPAMEKVRPLPIKCVGGGSIIPSFVPEKTEILPFGKRKYEEKRLCIGINTTDDGFGRYDGIVPAAIL